jgi:hypothetical protein
MVNYYLSPSTLPSFLHLRGDLSINTLSEGIAIFFDLSSSFSQYYDNENGGLPCVNFQGQSCVLEEMNILNGAISTY